MIRLEQIQLLEKKIDKTVSTINSLRQEGQVLKQENLTLKKAIQKSQEKMVELESLLDQFKGEQERIEAGILKALDKLDNLEDEIAETHNQKDGVDKTAPVKKTSEAEVVLKQKIEQESVDHPLGKKENESSLFEEEPLAILNKPKESRPIHHLNESAAGDTFLIKEETDELDIF